MLLQVEISGKIKKFNIDLQEHSEKLIGSDHRCDIKLIGENIPELLAMVIIKDNRPLIKLLDDKNYFTVPSSKKSKNRYLFIDEIKEFLWDDVKFSIYDEDSNSILTTILDEFVDFIKEENDKSKILSKLLEELILLTNADKALLYIYGEGSFTPVSSKNMTNKEIDKFSNTLLKEAYQSDEPILLNSIRGENFLPKTRSIVDAGIKSTLIFPLKYLGNTLGLIYLGSVNIDKIFTDEHCKQGKILSSFASQLLVNYQKIENLTKENIKLAKDIEDIKFTDIIGSSSKMREIFSIVEKVSKVDIPALILGETGTGKELISKEIHKLSLRNNRPFITVNCGAIPSELLESELFGHVKGSFTGAYKDKKGKFQLAHTGTLFLDEIGDLDIALQVKLLRVLQDGTVYKIGSETPDIVDVRIIAATNKNLEELIKTGSFREDLFYRLNVVSITLPPLRNRDKDIILIAKYLFSKFQKELNINVKGFSKEALIAIENYNWPGNIREMENRIKKALVLSDNELLSPSDLDFDVNSFNILSLQEAKDKFQEEYIEKILLLNKGNKSKTARDLGVDPRTIFRHLENLNKNS